jgi:hypothetical protein
MKCPVVCGPAFGDFSNRPKLTPAQTDTIVAWVDGGAPEATVRPAAASVRNEWSAL